jgi:hypothetical protein
MANHVIQPVDSNTDKHRTYRENMARYSLAMKQEFYFEAMLIDYAILEDRLSSMLFHIGALAQRTDTKVCAKVKKQLKSIVGRYTTGEVRLVIKSISGKEQILRSIARWAAETAGEPESDKYLAVLKEQFSAAEDLEEAFELLDQWRAYRNEVIHGLMNKNMDSLRTELPQQCAQGMQLARFFDSQLRQIKKGNRIRRCLKLKTAD